jgi:ribonucleotide reductase alpha subunit
MIPFESEEAKKINIEIFKFIKERTYKASSQLAQKY